MSRVDTVIWTATIDGTPIGRVQTGAGGGLTATSHKAWNGGIGEVERGGRRGRPDITLSRENDGDPTVVWLESKVNKRVSVHRTPADDDGNPRMAEQMARTGVLLGVTVDDSDTMNEGDVEMWTITIGLDAP
jgi:hypothetical protein